MKDNIYVIMNMLAFFRETVLRRLFIPVSALNNFTKKYFIRKVFASKIARLTEICVCFIAICFFVELSGSADTMLNVSKTFNRLKKEILVSQKNRKDNVVDKKQNISVNHSVKDRYDSIILKASEEFDLDPFLIKAVIEVESQFNHRAVSRRGAKGLMQLMPVTAKILGVEDRFNAESNIYGGARHIRGLIDRYKSVEKALGFYYAGRRYLRDPAIGTVYINKVMDKYNRLKEINSSICRLTRASDTT
ncbi:MAG: lytic transglycosylase domain-containing protein [Elusimicrobiota bacterium]